MLCGIFVKKNLFQQKIENVKFLESILLEIQLFLI